MNPRGCPPGRPLSFFPRRRLSLPSCPAPTFARVCGRGSSGGVFDLSRRSFARPAESKPNRLKDAVRRQAFRQLCQPLVGQRLQFDPASALHPVHCTRRSTFRIWPLNSRPGPHLGRARQLHPLASGHETRYGPRCDSSLKIIWNGKGGRFHISFSRYSVLPLVQQYDARSTRSQLCRRQRSTACMRRAAPSRDTQPSAVNHVSLRRIG